MGVSEVLTAPLAAAAATGVCSGYLCIKAAWPGMMRTLQGDHARYETTYFAPFKGFYFSGDGCRRLVLSVLSFTASSCLELVMIFF